MPSTAHSLRRFTDNAIEHGFTLIELMIVLAVLGVFATIALPSFQQLIANNRTLAVNNELLDLFQYARNTAVTQRKSISVCQNDSTWSVKTNCDDAKPLRTITVPSTVSVSSTIQQMAFRHNGSASAATLHTCYGDDPGNGFTIEVQASGRARSWSRGRSGPNSSDAMSSCTAS